MADFFADNESNSEITFGINKNYADRYNTWRQKEELQKLKDRYGECSLEKLRSTDSSSSEEEDENAKELTQQFEKEFYKTLSCLKKKDPRIYDDKVSFFEKQIDDEKQKRPLIDSKETKHEKPLFLRDYERKLIIERGGKVSDDDDIDEENGPSSTRIRPSSPTLVQEQKAIKDSFKSALANSDGEDDAEWGGLFQQRRKTEHELEKENEDYLQWLKGQKDQLPNKDVESDLRHLHDYWNDPNLDANEVFLRDYILNKKFLDQDDEDHIPTYEEIVHDSDDNLSEDEKTIERQEEFEHKFNFRFEEPDKEFIKRYPRTMENSLRKKDVRRKQKREEIRNRKEAEKATKRDEIKQLKALKRKEILEKIEKIKLITGNDDVGFKDEDLEEDFNPEAYDKRMSELFNDKYYGEDEEIKPEYPELDHELEIENWNTWEGENGEDNADENDYHEPHCEDPDFNMDCDYDPAAEAQGEMMKSTKSKKKHRSQSMFAELVAKSKPVFDPNDHTFDEYVEEYYKLDFEDVIGDLPCRFKYRKVISNDFGLTVDEILKADDKELNQWCSLKKTMQHKPDNVEIYNVKAFKKKALNESLKRRTLTSLYSEDLDEGEDVKQKKKRKRKLSQQNCTNFETDVKSNSGNNIKLKPVHLDIFVQNKGNRESSNHNESDITKSNDCGNEDSESNIKQRKKKKKKSFKHDQTEDAKPILKKRSNAPEYGNFEIGIQQESVVYSRMEKESDIYQVKTISNQICADLDDVQKDNNFAMVKAPSKKQRKKKKKQKHEDINTNKKVDHSMNGTVAVQQVLVGESKHKKVKIFKNKAHQPNESKHQEVTISDSRLKAYGINPKKFKNKQIYGKRYSAMLI